MTEIDPRFRALLAAQPHRLCFITLSGAHLYGFPSPDSDYDLRGAHVLPAAEVLGFGPERETVDATDMHDGVEMDVVTHDLRKFLRLLLGRNGYALEQVYSPLVVLSTPEFEELRVLARGCITRHHYHHYLAFAKHEWAAFMRPGGLRVKALLYLFRVLLSGIHLMRTGEVEANLPRLNEEYRLPQVPELIARKTAGPERSRLAPDEVEGYEREYLRLCGELEVAATASHLPDHATARPAFEDLLIRTRLRYSGLAYASEAPPR
jgi:uncharacterized protein